MVDYSHIWPETRSLPNTMFWIKLCGCFRWSGRVFFLWSPPLLIYFLGASYVYATCLHWEAFWFCNAWSGLIFSCDSWLGTWRLYCDKLGGEKKERKGRGKKWTLNLHSPVNSSPSKSHLGGDVYSPQWYCFFSKGFSDSSWNCFQSLKQILWTSSLVANPHSLRVVLILEEARVPECQVLMNRLASMTVCLIFFLCPEQSAIMRLRSL